MAQLEINAQSGQYRRYTLALDKNTKYPNIHAFKTKAGTQSIVPMIYTTATALANMNPANISPSKVIAKTNAGMFDSKAKEFYGIYYAGQGPVYINGKAYSGAPTSSVAYTDDRFWPSFCVKKDGTAAIRWFNSKAQLTAAITASKCIIGAVQPLIYDSKNVFEHDVMDGSSNGNKYLLYNKSGKESPQRFLYVGAYDTNRERTLLGHVKGSDGVYWMVCAKSLSIPKGAMVMQMLNCDYAVSLDGGSPSQMRVNGLGEVTSGTHDNIFTGVCAYTL